MNKVLVINGPNLNLLGKREIEIYGKESLKDIEINTKKFAETNNLFSELKYSVFKASAIGEDIEEPFINWPIISSPQKILELSFKQSNEESEIINLIQDCLDGAYKGLIINAGAYTHTSVAIFDALKAIKIPIIEIHLSNINKREEFRKKSFISEVANGVIFGFGSYGYILGVMAMKNLLEENG